MLARWPVTATLSATLFLIGLTASAINPYRGIVAIDELGMSNSVYALVTAISSLGTALVSLVLGNFADHMADRRVGVLACALFSTLAYGLIFAAPSQVTYIVGFCAILPFGGAVFSQTFSFSRAYYDQTGSDHAEFMMSALRTLFSLAWVVAPAIVGVVATRYSVVSVFGTAAGAQLACALVFSLLFVIPGTKIGISATEPAGAAPVAAARIPGGRLIGIGGVILLQTAIFMHLLGIPLVLTANFHGNLADVSFNAALAAGLEIPFMLAWGYAAARFAKEPVIVLSALIYTAYLGLIFFAHSVRDVLWLQGLNAIGTAALVSIPISYMQETFSGRVGLSTALLDIVTVFAWTGASGLFALFAKATDYIPVLLAASAVSLGGAVAVGISGLMRRGHDVPLEDPGQSRLFRRPIARRLARQRQMQSTQADKKTPT